MAEWVELPKSNMFPQPGDIVRFRRGTELSEPLRVSYVDHASKTVYFADTLPMDVREGDELVSL